MRPLAVRTPSDPRVIGIKQFSDNDQRAFATASSDYNPIHMDPVAARRLLTGQQVVHGVSLLLSALEYWEHDHGIFPYGLRCTFDNPVSVGETVVFTQQERDAQQSVIDVSVNDLRCVRIVIKTAPQSIEPRDECAPAGKIVRVNTLSTPLDQEPTSHAGERYAVRPNSGDFSSLFPGAERILGRQLCESIAALSYFVGMICPGLHSMLASLNLNLNWPAEITEDELIFHVVSYDSRFRLFDVTLEGAIQGSLEAFVRQAPHEELSLHEIEKHVRPDEFGGSRSLVIGGSRGLGALTAKILAAGGGKVIITYAAGLDDSRKVMAEINERFPNMCESLKFDVSIDALESLQIDREQLDGVYFFATPKIFKKSAGVFDPSRFQEFSLFYIQKFYELCAYLEAKSSSPKVRVYFPSSVAVEQRPKGLAEYAMAKAAAEALIQDINRSFKKVTVIYSRLPRLNTDQTASIQSVETESNLDALLPVTRLMKQ